MEDELESITRNKIWELVDRSTVCNTTQGILCDTKMEVCNTTHVGVCNTTHGGVCDTKVEACDTTHIPMESRFSKAEDEPEINQLGVERKADILPAAHVRKMADVTRVIIAVSFSHKTHRNLSEEVMRKFYKNWPILRRSGTEARRASGLTLRKM
ncbi:unnamed protein product [Brassica rapa]|uniref:Uncharacterized protein n=1 Tax=Brassica campestris TaxID=3711 RepID=A0A8D9H6C9_BRACM|nr:unnamed protein product [Brassica rapa]